MKRTKVTLSVDEDTLREAKSYLAGKDHTLSRVLEEALRELLSSNQLQGIATKLGVNVKYVSYDEVARARPTGIDAGRIVREMRDAREKVLPGQ